MGLYFQRQMLPPKSSLTFTPLFVSPAPPSLLCLLHSWTALFPHREPNVANVSVTKGIGVKMQHLYPLFVKRRLAASNAGVLWRWMCVSHRPLSRPPEERVILLLSRLFVCVCACERNSVFLHRLRLKLWYYLISRRKPLESCHVPPRHGPITGFNQ